MGDYFVRQEINFNKKLILKFKKPPALLNLFIYYIYLKIIK